MAKILIGIDPDVDKSGYAFRIGDKIKLKNLTFFELFEELKFYAEKEVKPTIYVECGFLNKSNWHKKHSGTAAINAAIGQKTGANLELAKKICEMCDYLKIPYVKVKPTATKKDSAFFKQLTGLNIRTNQEQRDAFMLIVGR